MDVLNPNLYQRLTRFGEVRISNPGQALSGTLYNNYGRSKYQITNWGETYRICCPFCAQKGNPDTRYRLSVNHRYGVGPPDSQSKDSFRYLATCFNNDCLSDDNIRKEFYFRVFGEQRFMEKPVIRPGIVTENKEVAFPGDCISLCELNDNHDARQYMFNRGFDPDYIGQQFNVAYCYNSDLYPLAVGRIIVPVYMDNILVGWQGRLTYDTINKKIPKYFTLPNFRTQLCLYNYDGARQSPYVIVCEGVTDVWRLGSPGVALFGKSMSKRQADLLTNWETIILLLDPETDEESSSIYNRLSAIKPVINVQLTGSDPADISTEQLAEIIFNHAEVQEIEIPLSN